MNIIITLLTCFFCELISLGFFHLRLKGRPFEILFGLGFGWIMILPLFGADILAHFSLRYEVDVNAFLLGTLIGYPALFAAYFYLREGSRFWEKAIRKIEK